MFNTTSLSNALEFIVDNRGKTVPVETTGFPLIATNCISNDNLYPKFRNIRFVSDEVYGNWFRAHPEPDDIILTNKGSKNGAICLVPKPVNFCIAQDMVALRAKKGIVDPKFLFAALRSSYVQNAIKQLNVDSVIPHFKKTDFNKLFFPLPDYEHQIVIGNCYFDFCQKIELNHQTNQTLEQIAQAIFKCWFVDFEPVKAKQHIHNLGGNKEQKERAAQAIIAGAINLETITSATDLDTLDQQIAQALKKKTTHQTQAQRQQLTTTASYFPDQLVELEMGLIPTEWCVKTLGDVSVCLDSKRIPLSKMKREEKKPGSIPYYGATSIMDYINEWIFDDIYLLLGEDGSVAKADGTPFIQYIWGKAWVNNHAHVLQGKNSVSTEQLMIFMQNQNISAYITGAVQLKLNQGNMKSIPFIDAGKQINKAFYILIKPIYESVRAKTEETLNLIGLRDTLLPKLLSGELTTNPTSYKPK